MITASVIHEVLPKLYSKTPLHKTNSSVNLCAEICGYQKKAKKSKSLGWVTSKENITRKRYVRKNKPCHINFNLSAKRLDYSYLKLTYT